MAMNEDPTNVLELIRQKVAKQVELAKERRVAENAELERVKLAPARNTISGIVDEFNVRRENVVGGFEKNRLSVKERLEKYGEARHEVKEKIAGLNRQLDEIERSEGEDKVKLEELSRELEHQLRELEVVRTRKLEKPLADLELAESEWHEKERSYLEEIAAKKRAEEQTIRSIRSIWEEEGLLVGPLPQTSLGAQQPLNQSSEVSQTIGKPTGQVVNPPAVPPTKRPEPSSIPSIQNDSERDQSANTARSTFTFNNTPPSSPSASTSSRNSRAASEVSEALSRIFVSSNVNSNSDSPSLQNGNSLGAENDFGFTFSVSPDGLYTSPDFMRGVPIAKITEESNYWMPSWTNSQTCIDEEKQSPKEVENTLKWFDEKCFIHPNQLISKQYYDKKGLLNRNYVNSLRKIFQNLSIAEISDPVRWLRVRLGKIIHERLGQPGIGFRLKQTLYDFKRNNVDYMEVCKTVSLKAARAKSAKAKGVKRVSKPKKQRPDAQLLSGPKRNQHNAELPPSQRPSKLQRVEAKASTEGYASPDSNVNSANKPRNDSSNRQPLPSTSLDHSLARKKLPSSKAQSRDLPSQTILTPRAPYCDASFDLTFFRCGVKKWESPNCPIRMKLNTDTKMFDPYHGDANLIALQPDLAIKPQEIALIEFHTLYGQGDTVMIQQVCKPGLGGWAGNVTKKTLAFKQPDDADRFAVLLCELNSDITLNPADRKRLVVHAANGGGNLLQARHDNENDVVHVQVRGQTSSTGVQV